MNKPESAENASPVDPEAIKVAVSDISDAAVKFIKKHPLECVGAAVLLGLVVGLIVKRK